MSAASLPTRWIACVDGTWCTPDGAYGNRHNNISNVYRICASIKVGECVDESSGFRFNQKKKYYNGLGSEKDIAWLKRLETGAFGSGVSEQIREVYEDCCMLPDHSQNEVWLFGFSRGAYVVRAVASLLHHIRALNSAGTPEFNKEFKHALQVYRSSRGISKREEVGQIHSLLAGHTRKATRIHFVGVLDTHFRHALALNEDRRAFEPEYYFPDYKRLSLARQSIVQAWFIGAHIDIGGSSAKDGLALYPLQWMLIESQQKGLQLEFDGSFGDRAKIDDPLKLVFPSFESDGKGVDVSTFTAKNNLKIDMQDIRPVHELPKNGTRYRIHLNQSKHAWMRKEPRAAFNGDGTLKGYYEYAAQGTTLHPSVYLIFDKYSDVFLTKALSFRHNIEELRTTVLTQDVFWGERETVDIEEPGTIRILVCGNTGVGKSTLINEVFGVEVTKASERAAGIHDIRIPIICPNRPDLIVHDSGGFESGGDKEFQQVKEFINEMSNATEMKNRLHVIWFCLEVNSPRVQQKATIDFFTIVSQNLEIPIVVVLTKKDEFYDLQYGRARKMFVTPAEMEAYADEELRQRMALIEEELADIKDGRCDSVVAVSREDKTSIQMLTEETARSFDHEKVRMLYIAAQVAHIDLKVNSALIKTMQIYKQTLRSAGSVSAIPLGNTTYRITVAALVCKAVVNAFGVPSVTVATVQQIVKSVVWDDIGCNFSILMAECIATVGVFGTVFTLGLHMFLAAGAINTTIMVPATAQLILMLSCDVILILVRAFRDCTHQGLGQPLKKDVETAAVAYRQFAPQVHQEIRDLISRFNIVQLFKFERIKIGVENITEKYTKLFIG